MKKSGLILAAVITSAAMLFGCGGKAEEAKTEVKTESSVASEEVKEEAKEIAEDANEKAEDLEEKAEDLKEEISKESIDIEDLTGHKIFAYCGAGMTKPFTKICETFGELSHCKMEPSFNNGAQIRSQITTSNEGDFFVAGSMKDIKDIDPYDEHVGEVKNLVKHIPVLAVKEGNPKNINSLLDLTNEGVTFVMGSVEQTPIGKIAKKALTEKGIFDKVNMEAETPTAPAMIQYIANGEVDACIVWKENCEGAEGVEIVDTEDLDNFVKTIPVAMLKSADDEEACEAFWNFLDTDTAKDIWKEFGYEIVEK